MSNPVLEEYRSNQALLERAVTALIREAVAGFDTATEAVAIRDALLSILPDLVETYGAAAAEVAVDFYRATLPVGAAFVPLPVVVSADAREAVVENVRYLADGLFTDAPQDAVEAIAGAATRHIRNAGRETIMVNAQREGVGFARVPTGAMTCAFCLMQASRSIVHHSSGRFSDGYHDHCDCEVIRIEKPEDYPAGYLPDDALQMYEAARDEADDPGDIHSILYQFRRLYPDAVKDGVRPPA